MKNRNVVICMCILVLICFCSSLALAQGQLPEKEIRVTVDTMHLTFDVQPVIRENRTLVPFRAIAEALGVKVDWEGSTQTVKASDGKNSVAMQIGSDTALRNGAAVRLDVPPLIINERTMIPLRFFGEAFVCNVLWDQSTYSVNISSAPKKLKVTGFYALGDSKTSSWTNLFGLPYPETGRGHTDVVDELALGWFSIDGEGNLLTRSRTGWQRPPGWENVLLAAGSYNLKTEMVIHVSDRDRSISTLLASEAAVDKLLDAIMAEVAVFGGVNLNFEEYGHILKEDLPAAQQLFNRFVLLLSERLRTAGKSLTLTLHPPNSYYRGYDYKVLGELADRIIIMAYDYGPKPEPVHLVLQAVELAAQVVTPQKLILGISVPYETPESILTKVEIARRYKLPGIALWRLGLVSAEMWQALRTVMPGTGSY